MAAHHNKNTRTQKKGNKEGEEGEEGKEEREEEAKENQLSFIIQKDRRDRSFLFTSSSSSSLSLRCFSRFVKN